MNTNNIQYLVPEAEQGRFKSLCQQLLVAEKVSLANAATILYQPPMTNTLLDTLPENQAISRDHATKFELGEDGSLANIYLITLNTISSSVKTFLESAIENFNSAKNPSDNKEAVQNLIEILKVIKTTSLEVDEDSGAYINTLIKNYKYYDPFIIQNLNDDFIRMDSNLKTVKNEQKVSELYRKNTEFQNELTSVNSKIASGATKKLGNSVEFGISISTIGLGAINPGALVGAGLKIAGLAKDVVSYNAEISQLYEKQEKISDSIVQLAEKLEEAERDQATLALIAAQIKSFYFNAKDLLVYAASISEILQNWEDQLDNFDDYIQNNPNNSEAMKNQLSSGIKFWKDIEETTAALSGKLISLSTS